jgi:hypothetical protein
MEAAAKLPWKNRFWQAAVFGLLTGLFGAAFQPGTSWVGIPIGVAGGLVWFALEPLIKPRRPLRDPVREESIAATEEAIRLAEMEIEGRPDRST